MNSKKINFWEIVGKTTAIFTIVGAVTGPAINIGLDVSSGKNQLSDITSGKIAYESFRGVQNGSLSGFITGVGIGAIAARRRKDSTTQPPPPSE